MQSRPVNFIVPLRVSAEYKPLHAKLMQHMVQRHLCYDHRFLCVTDDQTLSFGLTLQENWPGWWCTTEMFRVKGTCIATGLDSVIVSDITELALIAKSLKSNEVVMLRPFGPPDKYASGIMMWNGDLSFIYETMKRDPQKWIKRFYREQRFTSHVLLEKGYKIIYAQDVCNGFYSYKHHIRKSNNQEVLPEDAKMIIFHGQPRPFDRKVAHLPWIKEHYYSSVIHR